MYKQEITFYPDTFQLHITKEYVNNILIEEKYFTQNNKIYYYKDYIANYMIKRFFFYNEELSKKYSEYYYLLTQIDDDYNLSLYTEIDDITIDVKTVNKKYILTNTTCTQLCTLNNDEAIQFIQNYIKIEIIY